MSSYSQKQVIYLISSPLSERDFWRFGIKNWIDHGWKVDVFDFTKFLFPKFWKYVEGEKLTVDFEALKIFNDNKEFLSALKNLQHKVVFIDFLGFSYAELKIRKIIRTHGVFVRLLTSSLPEVKKKLNILNLFILIKSPIVFMQKLIFFMKNKFKQIIAQRYLPDFWVVSGTKSMSDINDKKTSIIKAHNFDYDKFIQKNYTKSNRKKDSLVFLDEGGPYHSDFIYSEIRPFVTLDKYYQVIDFGLSKMAKSLKLDIKIAAHPRCNYDDKQIKYKHTIIKNKTFELIRDASVVVSHMSTALQWAVVMKKPIIFVTTDEIQNEFYAKSYSKHIDCFAETLGKKVVNLSDLSSINNWENYLNVDEEKYEQYIETYVKTKESQQKLLWDIVIEHIQKDFFL